MSGRDVIHVTGAEAAGYLQGQISQDVDRIDEGDVAWSLVLDPTGKVAGWFRIERLADGEFLLDTERGFADELVARLERFKLRTDVHFADAVDRSISEPLRWPGLVEPFDERARIVAGMPRLGRELTGDTIPAEAGQTLVDLSVSFTKGCYTGQELVARIDSRGGNVPRPVRLLQGAGPYREGAVVTFDGEPVGVVTSAAGDVALAPVMRKVAIGATVDVDGLDAQVSAPAES